MTISDLKDLKKLIELCRKTGVDSIRVDGVELHLGALASKQRAKPRGINASIVADPLANAKIEYTPVSQDMEELTDEQLLFYSSQGHEQETV